MCCLHEVTSGFGLTVSAAKTQFVVVGPDITPTDRAPLLLGQAEVECVPQFKYLGSVVDNGSRLCRDIAARIARASGACSAPWKSVFSNPHLLMHTKRCVFNACVLSLLLYGSECWAPLQLDLKKLSTFSMRCIRSILRVSRSRMWDEHISKEELLVRWGDSEMIKDKIAHRRLEWLGHVARMPDNRIPKQVVFGSFCSVARHMAHAAGGRTVLSGIYVPMVWRHHGMMLHVSLARSGAAPTKSLTMRLSLRPEWYVRYVDRILHRKETWLSISVWRSVRGLCLSSGAPVSAGGVGGGCEAAVAWSGMCMPRRWMPQCHLALPERRHRRRDVVPRIVTGVVAAFPMSGDGADIAVQGWPIDQQQRSAQPSSTCAYAASGCDYP